MRRIFYAGDSTVSFNKIGSYPQTGMSQALPLYLSDDVWVRSYAVNGRSTKSFIDEGRLDEIEAVLTAGDYLYIQFGHNDEKKEDPTRYAAAATDYRDNLKRFIDAARSHDAYPVLLTPIARRLFDENGRFLPGSHGDYPAAVHAVAKEMGVPCIDLTAPSEAYLAALGDYASRLLYVYPKDNSHLTMQGAVVMAGFLAAGMKRLGAPYATLLDAEYAARSAAMQQDSAATGMHSSCGEDRAAASDVTGTALQKAFVSETAD